jgi:hypothetical protein
MIASHLEKQPHLELVDDEGSLSSTVAVEYLSKSLGIVKQVAFNLEHNQEYPHKLYKEQLPALWYSASDRNECRIETRAWTAEIRTKTTPLSYERVMTRLYRACCQAEHDTIQDIVTPVEALYLMKCVDAKLVGIKAASRERSERRKAHSHAVLLLAQDEDYEALCSKSKSSSLASRLFSQALAAAVAGDIDSECKERRLVNCCIARNV